MTRFNSRSRAGLLTMLCLSLVLASCGSRLTAEEKVDLARSQLAEGDAASAAIHLRVVLQDDPSNVHARVLLAEAALRVGDLETAAKEFRRALDLGAELDEFRVSYAEALVRAGASRDALLLTEPEEAGDGVEISYWRALAFVRAGMPDEAEVLLKRIAQDPVMQVKAQVGLARVAVERQRPEQALAILDGISADAAGSSDYWEVVASASMASGQYERAAEASAKAAATAIDATGIQKFVYRGAEVEALLAAGRLPEARSRAERMLESQHPLAHYLMGRVELQAGNPQQALAHGQAILAANPHSDDGHLLMGMAYLGLDQHVQAERSLERAVAASPNNMNARRLLAQTRLRMQMPQRALEALGPITDETLDAGVAALAGMASVSAGDPSAAIDILQRQLEQNPGDDQARSMLAVSLLAAGRVEEALAQLSQVSDSDAAVRQRADLIEIGAYLHAGSHHQARDAADELAATHPGDAPLRASLGGLFLAKNHLDEAAAWFEDGLRLDPTNLAAHFSLGRIAAAMGELEQARQHFGATVAADPANGAALAELARLDWADGDHEAAVAQLQKARAANPVNVNARLLLAGYLAALDRIAEARVVAEEAVAAAPGSAAAANVLGATLLQAGRGRDALPEFVRAHRIEPGAPVYLINKARAELATGQLEPARQSLVQALALDADSVFGLATMVEVEIRAGRLDSAARTFARLERAASADDVRVDLIRGELLLAQEDYAGAERAFASALERDRASVTAAIGIFEARRRASADNAEQPLLAAQQSQPDDSRIRTALGAYYIEVRKYHQAIEQYESLLRETPDNAALVNNLAWLYNEVGEPRALEYAERAHKLAPRHPMIADTLGWILHQRGDSARALELISKAASDAPQVGEIQYHHAVLLAETGDTADAIRAARRVLADAGAANYHESAQKLLDRLEQGKE